MKTKFRINVFFILIILLAVAAAVMFLMPQTEKAAYSKFKADLNSGAVEAVVLQDETLEVTLKSGGKYAVPNPELPTLKEELLLKDVKISNSKSAEETISLVFDCAFYLFFFGIIFVAFRKFISPNTFKVVRKTGVTFKDVTGMNQLKKDMLQIIDIMQHPAEYAKKGIRMPKGVLLEGAPGNGKTLFARALAGEGKINFIPAKATDFESMFMAIGPLKVKLLFKKARRHAPCIVFIDEFDGIGTKRNYSGSAIETENTRIVTALLNELDGFTPNQGILVLAATNSRKALDEALIRAGRFDAKYVVPFPDFEMRKELAVRFLEAKQYELDVSAESLAKLFDGFCAAQIESVINKAALIAGQLGRASFSMNDIKTAMKEI
ncbi:MAG: ATP-dependent metallopeptidase FtsH/Yme1/Tma family protein [Spirochaetaceae bacterium]|nr:ATP-dependent metallopeptidase FtsH/Yme1/Tma family protein [Spirochaetaceae bacterium]